jgi:hypothetical protein
MAGSNGGGQREEEQGRQGGSTKSRMREVVGALRSKESILRLEYKKIKCGSEVKIYKKSSNVKKKKKKRERGKDTELKHFTVKSNESQISGKCFFF